MSVHPASDILRRLNPEIWIITSADGPRRGGLISTTVAQASIVPELPRLTVGLAKQHATWPLVENSRAFAAHLIGEDQIEWVWRFGLQSGRDADKLAGLSLSTAETGSPILQDALAWLDCRVEAALDTGDRTLYLAEVVAGGLQRDAPPLTMQRMLELASPEHRRQLKDALDRDGHVDAEAIRQWRASR